MSYARCGEDSDVYVLLMVGGYTIWPCMGKEQVIKIFPGKQFVEFIYNTPEECLNKLLELKVMGLLIPDYALERLKDEIGQ